MTDIVERLKDAETATHALFNYIFQDAREEIERLRIENEALRAEVIHIKEVEFPRKAQAVADGWRDKCERLEAKIAEMEQQKPVGTVHAMPGAGAFTMACFDAQDIPVGAMLYALPGAQGVPDVDALAQFIREIDGKHQLGAGALAERIVEWLAAAPKLEGE